MRDNTLSSHTRRFDQSAIATGVIDPQRLSVLYANDALTALVKNHHVHTGDNLVLAFDDIRDALQRCAATGEFVGLDKADVRMRLELTPLSYTDSTGGELRAVQCMVIPMRALDEGLTLDERDDAYKRILNYFPHNVWLCSPKGEVFWTNRTSNLFTYGVANLDDLGNTRWVSKIHPDDLERTSITFSRAMMEGKLLPFRYRLRDYTGRFYWFLFTAAPVLDDAGQVRYWVGSSINIDSFVQTEHELQVQLDALRGQSIEEKQWLDDAQRLAASAQKMELVTHLAGGVAHDLNNLLFVMRMNMDLLQSKLSAEPQLAHVAAVRECIRKAARLASQLSAFSGRLPQSAAAVAPGEMMAEMRELITQAVGAEAQLSITVDDNLHVLCVDRMYLENALINLSINARDAGLGRGKINITVRNQAVLRDGCWYDYVVFSVQDDGEGMSPEVYARIWEPFFTTKLPGRGTGLGLPMVKNFVDSSRGYIEVQSLPQHGTTVAMFLPKSELGVAVAEEEDLGATGGKETVLLVEDNAQVREVVAEVLRGLGYNIITSFNPEHAMVFIQSQVQIDLIISDVKMPGQYTVLDMIALVESTTRIPIIFATGYSAEIAVKEGLIEGKYPVLFKPFATNEMAEAIREALEASRRERARNTAPVNQKQ